MFEINDDVDNHIKVMLGNFDAEPYVYLHVNKLMLVNDNLNDELPMLVSIHADDVHDDIHLNVDDFVVV